MHLFKAGFCRVFQPAFRIALPFLPYREPEIIRSCAELHRVLEKEQIHSPRIVTDKGIVRNGLVEPLEAVLKSCGLARHADKEANPLYPVPKRMDIRELEDIYHKITDGSVEP